MCDFALLTTSQRSSPGATYRTSTSCPARLCSRRQCRPGSSCFTCLHKSPLMFSRLHAQNHPTYFTHQRLVRQLLYSRGVNYSPTLHWVNFAVNKKALPKGQWCKCVSIYLQSFLVECEVRHWMNKCVISSSWEHHTTGSAAIDASTMH